MTRYRIGIDVGGTNTDAVMLSDNGKPVESTKTTTSEDITTGIIQAFDETVAKTDVDVAKIDQVMFGTTHCTNAIAERRGLSKVGVLRLGAPATTSVQPFAEWPSELSSAVGDNTAILEGGHEFDGREIRPLDEAEVRRQVQEFEGVDAFAVTSVFSPVKADQEQTVRKIIYEEFGEEVTVSLSHEIGSLGLLERENATILNAALMTVAERTVDAFLSAMRQREVDTTLYFARNDGTLMNTLQATQRPIFMISSGPANSIRGAAHLSGVQHGIVIDVGGTTTDIGMIKNGFPRASSAGAEIGGVTTNIHLPDIVSLAIGGGSLVTEDPEISVGPESVGRQLNEVSRAYGGEITTATDVGVANGMVSFGTQSVDLDEAVISGSREYIRSRLERAINQIRTEPDPLPAIVVGGASFLIPEELDGITSIHRPEYYDTANAIGVATAQVSGQSDQIYNLDDQSRDAALSDATDKAVENAVSAGANRETVSTLSVQEIPLAYLDDDAVRIKIEVAGDLQQNPGRSDGGAPMMRSNISGTKME